MITETLHYDYSLHPKWSCAHFCYLFTELNSIQTTTMADESQDDCQLVLASLKSECCDFSVLSAGNSACPPFNLVRNSISHSPSFVIRDPRYENVSTCSSCSFRMSMRHAMLSLAIGLGPEKKWIFHMKWRVLCILSGIFVRILTGKMLWKIIKSDTASAYRCSFPTPWPAGHTCSRRPSGWDSFACALADRHRTWPSTPTNQPTPSARTCLLHARTLAHSPLGMGWKKPRATVGHPVKFRSNSSNACGEMAF